MYHCTLRRDSQQPQSVLARVGSLLQQPILSHSGGRLHRLRRPDPVVVQLHPACVDAPLPPVNAAPAPSRCRAPELTLNFWPAGDPKTAPPEQCWLAYTPKAPQRERPHESLCGWLEKRSPGAFHHWARKWVSVADGKLKYWADRSHFTRGDQPK